MERYGSQGQVRGDAGLLTLRTAELIEEADVIVYDALLSAEILSRIPRETETIYVGKHAGNHPVPQEEINQILVREAKKGKRVLRLKGGDPFVFGRGGEEIEILRNEKISFEIIPGITSSVAVSGLCGDSGDSSRLYLILSCDYRTYEKRCKTRH